MTYQDPDPMRDRNFSRDRQPGRDYGSNAMWGWIAGAVVLVLMLVFLFGGTTDGTNTADVRGQSSASAPTINTPPANNLANRPPQLPPSETTGQNR